MSDSMRPGGVTIKVFSTLAAQGAMPLLGARFGAASGYQVESFFAPTNALLERIRTGERVDLAILTQEAVCDLSKRGLLGPVCNVAISRVGIAIKTGAPKPDIDTVDNLKATLLAARSIAYSRIGASGIFFADLIARLGIAEAVNAKATVIPAGFTAELVARGEVDLAVQQISELMVIPGIDVAGALPDALGGASVFSAGVFLESPQSKAAGALLAYFATPEAAEVLRATGLVPA